MANASFKNMLHSNALSIILKSFPFTAISQLVVPVLDLGLAELLAAELP